jgi:hypothetical protein
VRVASVETARALSLGFETAQARTLGFEQTRDADDGRVVVEEREHLDCPRQRAQERPGGTPRTQSLGGLLPVQHVGGLLRVWNLFDTAVAAAFR